jgi:hypothetical protein
MIPLVIPPDVDMPERAPYRTPNYLDAPRYPDMRPPINLMPMPPNFHNERYQHDYAPQPPPAPAQVGSVYSPLQVGAVSGGVPQAYQSPDLQGILSRIFGNG